MRDYLRLIREFPHGPRNDVTPVFADPEAFDSLVNDLIEPFKVDGIALVAGIDALGFIVGTAVALKLKVGFLPIRKADKLPGKVRAALVRDYSGKEKGLEVNADAVLPGTRVLLVDEWSQTGAQLTAAAALIEELGGVIAGVCVINMDRNEGTQALRHRYKCHSLMGDGAA
jgi:adenine phosphoribosyltransferase